MKPTHEHVDLLVEVGPSGRPLHEQVPARQLTDGSYEIAATPALARGCAAGDVLLIAPDGGFQVLRRGGNVAIQAFSAPPFAAADVQRLADAIEPLGGVVEAPAHMRFLVVTVPARAGFEAIEAAMTGWHATVPNAEWSYGNVYAADGTPLDWWRPT